MTSPSPSLLVLDAGTSSVRAALFRDGVMVAQARRPLELIFPAPGRAEQDAREIWLAAQSALDEVAARLAGGEPAVLGLTAQRSTVVLWDAETARPLGPALSWRDSRAVDEAATLAGAVPDVATRTGLPASPHYGAPKIAWALRHWPEVRAAADAGTLRVGPVSSWLVFQLTRGQGHAVDPTHAQRMLLMDLRTLEWDPALLRALHVPLPALPPILPTDGRFGDAHVNGRLVPIRAVLGDQQAALLGLAGSTPADAVAGVQLGTGAFVLLPSGQRLVQAPGLLSGLARADANRPRLHLVEGTVNAAGSAFDRLREVGLLHEGEDLDATCATAAGPCVVVPGWGGLGTPRLEPRAAAAILGWSEAATRADLVMGTVRGIAFLVADVVDAMRGGGLTVSALAVSGGLSASRALCQALSDATRLPVDVRTNAEASLEGIALALAEACELDPPRLSVEHGRRHEPDADLSADRARFAVALDAVQRLARLP